MKTCHLIGIAGGSCTGKSFLCKYLLAKYSEQNCIIISMDAYYHDLSHIPFQERSKRNFDVPEAIDHNLLIEHLQNLIAGKTVSSPYYDFNTHTRKTCSRNINATGKIVLFEGLYALYWEEIRQLYSLKIFIDLDQETSLRRRFDRDTKERGRSVESIEQQFRQTVLPMYEKYIYHTRYHADLIISGDAPINVSGDQVIKEAQVIGLLEDF